MSTKEYRKKNKDKIKASAKEYREKNKDKAKRYWRKWYAKNRDRKALSNKVYNATHPEIFKKLKEKRQQTVKFKIANSAWIKVYRALESGKLVRKPCEVCGIKKVQAHHDDYAKPLEVKWLCRMHHEQIHHPY